MASNYGKNDTSPTVAYSAGFGGVVNNTTVDELVAADVAASIAYENNLIIADSVGNLSDSLSAKVEFATTNETYLEKQLVVDTNSKTRQDVIKYTSKRGDTISDLAARFNVTSDTIKWANDLYSNALPVGRELTIPPVSGVVHKVTSTDTAESVAQKYNANAQQIIAFNDAEVNGLPVGENIIVPDGAKPAPVTRPLRFSDRTFAFGTTQPLYGGNGYSYGYCTWYAANRRAAIGRPIPRNLGHAVTWASLASRSGLVVAENPIAGAVIWHKNTYIANGYGHVAFVESINADGSAYIADMNWAGWNRVTYRTIQPAEFNQYLFIH